MASLNINDEIDNVHAADPERRSDRFFVCPVCGQTVDREHLGQMYHHSEEPHERLAD